LSGWIERDKCILWDNQVAIYYDKETLRKRKRKTAPILQKQEDLRYYLNYGYRKNIIGEEQNNYWSQIPPQTRFPVIETRGNGCNTKKLKIFKTFPADRLLTRAALIYI